MKWFQHDSNASSDAKIKKLILKHGAVGYAVYFHCLELIASDITISKITFELEHDAEIIADNLKIEGTQNESAIDIVNRIMKTIISLGLFEEQNNKIFCFKLAKRLDNTISRSPDLNKIKQTTTKLLRSNNEVATKKLGADKIRLDKIRLDKIRYKDNILLTEKEFNKLNNLFSKQQVEILLNYLSDYKIEKEYKTKSDYLTIRRWVVDACKKISAWNNNTDEKFKVDMKYFGGGNDK